MKNDLDALSKFIFLILRKQYLTLLYWISLFQLCDYKTCILMSLLIFLFDLYLWAWFLFYIASLIIITLPTIAVAIGRCRSLSLCKVKAKSKGRWFDIVSKIKKKWQYHYCNKEAKKSYQKRRKKILSYNFARRHRESPILR